MNKSVGFKAIVSSFIVGEIYTHTCILAFSRYPVVQVTWYRVDSDLLTPSINRSITDPLLFDGSLSFSLPTDKMTEYSVTLTDENGTDLVFENILISESITIM